MSFFSQKFYLYSSNFKPCKLVKTQFQSIVFLSPPNSAAKNTWSLYLIELLIRGQIDQLGFAFFLFSAFLTCTRVNVDCMFPDEGRLNCVSTMTKVSKFCPRIMKPFLKWTQYRKLAPNALRFTYWNLKSCKPQTNKNIKMLKSGPPERILTWWGL